MQSLLACWSPARRRHSEFSEITQWYTVLYPRSQIATKWVRSYRTARGPFQVVAAVANAARKKWPRLRKTTPVGQQRRPKCLCLSIPAPDDRGELSAKLYEPHRAVPAWRHLAHVSPSKRTTSRRTGMVFIKLYFLSLQGGI